MRQIWPRREFTPFAQRIGMAAWVKIWLARFAACAEQSLIGRERQTGIAAFEKAGP